MTHLLPPLHDGHAPIFLQQAFHEALDAYEDWTLDSAEPQVEFDGRAVPISSVFGRMRTCTDVLPLRTRDTLKAVAGDAVPDDDTSTYAKAASVMRALAVQRLRS